jgi:hypothetical protein
MINGNESYTIRKTEIYENVSYTIRKAEINENYKP